MNKYFKYVLKNLKMISIGLLDALIIVVLIILIFAIPLLFITGIMEKQPILCVLSVLGGIIFILIKSFFDMEKDKKNK